MDLVCFRAYRGEFARVCFSQETQDITSKSSPLGTRLVLGFAMPRRLIPPT